MSTSETTPLTEETNSEDFLTQSDLINKVISFLKESYFMKGLDFKKKELFILKIIRGINELCEKENTTINSINYLTTGQDACIFECAGKIIKVTKVNYDGYPSLRDYFSRTSCVLQPLEEILVEIPTPDNYHITIHLFEKLDTKEIGPAEATEAYIRLRNDGYLWYDPKYENVGRDKDGNLKLFDYGQVININDMDDSHRKKEIEANEAMFPQLAKAYAEYLGSTSFSSHHH